MSSCAAPPPSILCLFPTEGSSQMNVSDIEDHGWPCTCPLVREGRQTAHSQPSLSLGIWDWHQPGLEAPLAYCGTSWPVPAPPVPRYYSQVTPPLPPVRPGPQCAAAASTTLRSHEGCRPQAEQPKVLSAVEERMDELGAGIAQSRRTVALIKVRPDPSPGRSCSRLLAL